MKWLFYILGVFVISHIAAETLKIDRAVVMAEMAQAIPVVSAEKIRLINKLRGLYACGLLSVLLSLTFDGSLIREGRAWQWIRYSSSRKPSNDRSSEI